VKFQKTWIGGSGSSSSDSSIRFNTTDSGCHSSAGDKIKPGETWYQDNFKYKCLPMGGTEVIACTINDGKETKDIPVGSSLKADKWIWECNRMTDGVVKLEPISADGSVITSIKGFSSAKDPGCKSADGAHYNTGETWYQKNFKYRCLAMGGTEIIACTVKDGTQTKDIAVGSKLTLGNLIWHCDRMSNGWVTLQPKSADGTPLVVRNSTATAKDPGCKSNDGSYHAEGETWYDKGFKFKCLPMGATEIIACSKNGTDIAVGGSLKIGDWIWDCTRTSAGLVNINPRKAL